VKSCGGSRMQWPFGFSLGKILPATSAMDSTFPFNKTCVVVAARVPDQSVAATDSSFDRWSRSVSGSRCFATENAVVFKLFHTNLSPARKRAKYVPDGLYRTRFCIAVACQTSSSDVLIPAVASVERCPKERRHRSSHGADVSLRELQNGAN
jgi:hypothetical protein